MTLSAKQLLNITQDYWDSSKDFYLRQETSPRLERLQTAWAREFENMDRWWSFREALQHDLPEFEFKLMGSAMDAGFRFIATSLPSGSSPPISWALVGCVSILAPVYAVYGVEYEVVEGHRSRFKARYKTDLPGMHHPAQRIARKIEETFGYHPLSDEVARTPVPLFVEPQEPPHTTLFHALFTSEPERIP